MRPVTKRTTSRTSRYDSNFSLSKANLKEVGPKKPQTFFAHPSNDRKYPYPFMKKGEYFTIPIENSAVAAKRASDAIHSSSWSYRMRHGVEEIIFVSRYEYDKNGNYTGVRCIRIE